MPIKKCLKQIGIRGSQIKLYWTTVRPVITSQQNMSTKRNYEMKIINN